MLDNLRIEMLRGNITTRKLAEILNMSEDAVRNKIYERSTFKVPEAVKLRDALFPDMSIEYLFASDNPGNKTA